MPGFYTQAQPPMRDATLITTAEQLAAAVFRMRGATRLALDTEFMRERTYYPQLCLIQVATDADCVLVDPLNGLGLDLANTVASMTPLVIELMRTIGVLPMASRMLSQRF